MSRGIHADLITAIATDTIRPRMLVFMDFPSAARRFWTGVGNLSWGGNTYQGAGDLLTITEVSEVVGVEARGAQVVLSGIDQNNLSDALAENYRRKALKYWLALVNKDRSIIGDPVLLFSGKMSKATIYEGGQSSTIEMVAENDLAGFNRAKELRWNDQDQRRLHPGDSFFKFLASSQDRKVPWGRAGALDNPRTFIPPNEDEYNPGLFDG